MVTQMDVIGEEIAKLSQKEQQIIKADAERWQGHLDQASHLKEWLAFGPGLLIRQRMALRLSNSQRPIGRRYSEQMNLICKQTEKLAAQITSILWLHGGQPDEPEGRMDRLNRILADMSPYDRAMLNLPTSARLRVMKSFDAEQEAKEAAEREAQGLPPLEEPEKGPTLKEINIQLQEEVHSLQERLKVADGGNLFDFDSDGPEFIANTFRESWRRTPSKLRALARELNRVAKEAEALLKTAKTKSDDRMLDAARTRSRGKPLVQVTRKTIELATAGYPVKSGLYSFLSKADNALLVRINNKLAANNDQRRLTALSIPLLGTTFALEGADPKDTEGGMERSDVVALAQKLGVDGGQQ
jgi:hypothetical protein